jgi:PPM family protein phosphatase
MPIKCDRCGGIVSAGDRFCEECGASIGTKVNLPVLSDNCQKCGASPDRIDDDRFCEECGARQLPLAHDPIELQPTPELAGVSDRGNRHHHNEDAIALKIIDDRMAVIVVCDGVSSSQHPELASQAAAAACVEAIERAIHLQVTPNDAIERGIAAALAAVTKIPFDPTLQVDPSSTTIVAALVRDRIATIGWLGDSRAYWIAPEKSLQLTADDSWVREAIATGQISQAEAETSPHAHAITRWLGADTGDDDKPNLTTFTIPSAGYLLLCTDGLWNYAPAPSYIYHLIQQAATPDPLVISRYLMKYANSQGGQDNITVGILGIRG